MNTRAPRRLTTEAERELFYDVLADVKPLKVQAPRKKKASPQPKPASKPKPPAKIEKVAKRPVRTPDEPPAFGGHRAVQVRKGRVEPEAKFDLHGMTQETAHRALFGFLHRARANGARVVLVVTGKSGVLNRQFKPWLAQGEFGALVSGVSSAHKRHGGSGAYYVLLKRAR